MTLTIIDNSICCKSEDKLLWSIPINELVFVGEYTTSAGPWFDDWFYVFSNEYDTWYQVPFEAELTGDSQFWTHLGEKLNCELAPSLTNSTIWKTNVIYPISLNGEELFKVTNCAGNPTSLWQRIFNGNSDEKIELTDKVKALFVKN